jgi:hypothetical protein
VRSGIRQHKPEVWMRPRLFAAKVDKFKKNILTMALKMYIIKATKQEATKK